MPASHLQRTNLPKRIFWTLILTAVVAVAANLLMLVWMASSTNRLAAQNASEMVKISLVSQQERLTALVVDYAFWEASFDWFQDRDEDAIYENLGTGATESASFDLLYIADAQGEPVYGFVTDGTGSDFSVIDVRAVSMMNQALLNYADTPQTTVASMTIINGEVMMLTAARIHPDDTGDRPATDFPILIGGTALSRDRLAGIGSALMLHDLTVMPGLHEQNTFAGNRPLYDITGQRVGNIHWTPPQPGTALLWQAIPVVAVLSLALSLAIATIARGTARLASTALHERQLARTDQLTGLVNRAGLADLVSQPEIISEIKQGHCAVFFLDLNGFKALNDNFGHDAGDTALKITGQRLKSALRANDHVARLGGDEFVCLIIDPEPDLAARHTATRIAEKIAAPFAINGRKHQVSASIGIAVSEGGASWDMLLAQADHAMFNAKQQGTNAPILFHEMNRATASSPLGAQTA